MYRTPVVVYVSRAETKDEAGLPSHCTALLSELQGPSSRGSPRWQEAASPHHHCQQTTVSLMEVLIQSPVRICCQQMLPKSTIKNT